MTYPLVPSDLVLSGVSPPSPSLPPLSPLPPPSPPLPSLRSPLPPLQIFCGSKLIFRHRFTHNHISIVWKIPQVCILAGWSALVSLATLFLRGFVKLRGEAVIPDEEYRTALQDGSRLSGVILWLEGLCGGGGWRRSDWRCAGGGGCWRGDIYPIFPPHRLSVRANDAAGKSGSDGAKPHLGLRGNVPVFWGTSKGAKKVAPEQVPIDHSGSGEVVVASRSEPPTRADAESESSSEQFPPEENLTPFSHPESSSATAGATATLLQRCAGTLMQECCDEGAVISTPLQKGNATTLHEHHEERDRDESAPTSIALHDFYESAQHRDESAPTTISTTCTATPTLEDVFRATTV